MTSCCCRWPCRRFTVKVATVSFVKNLDKGLAPGGGMFLVFDAADGQIKGIFQENRFMTDVRTGAAGGVAVKYLSKPTDSQYSSNLPATQHSKVAAVQQQPVRNSTTTFCFRQLVPFRDRFLARLVKVGFIGTG